MPKQPKNAFIMFVNLTAQTNNAVHCNVEAVDTIVGWYTEVHSGDHIKVFISYPKRREDREMNPPRTVVPLL